MVPASLNDRFVIRFCICQENSTDRDVLIAYDLIKQFASSILCRFLQSNLHKFYANLWESYSFAYKRLKRRKLSIFTSRTIFIVAKLFIFIEFFQVNCLPFEASKIDEPINETIAENVELEELEAQQYEGGRIVNSSSIKSLSNRKVNFKKLLKMTNWRIF